MFVSQMEYTLKECIVIGAGISGLAVSYFFYYSMKIGPKPGPQYVTIKRLMEAIF